VCSREGRRLKIEGNIVLVGTTAGLRDVAPRHSIRCRPVSVHAQIIEQILLGEYLERPDWATGAELLYLFALGLPLALLIPRVGAVGTALLGGGGIAIAVALSWYAYSAWRWLLDPIYPGLAALGVYLVGSLQNFLQSEAQRRSVRAAFSRISRRWWTAGGGSRSSTSAAMRDMTLLFCDVRGFTSIGAARSMRSRTSSIAS
jgi:adenylate cyclase